MTARPDDPDFLELCPCCGGDGIYVDSCSDCAAQWSVGCTTCWLHNNAHTRADALAAWNRRAALEPQDAPAVAGVEIPAGHTPGPWEWGGYPDDIRLQTVKHGKQFVMTFARKGMQGGQPRFQIAGYMHNAAEDLITFQVGDSSVRGEREAKKNSSVYRPDVSGIDHPDAQLIKIAPLMAKELVALRARVAEAETACRIIDAAVKAGHAKVADLVQHLLEAVEPARAALTPPASQEGQADG